MLLPLFTDRRNLADGLGWVARASKVLVSQQGILPLFDLGFLFRVGLLYGAGGGIRCLYSFPLLFFVHVLCIFFFASL